MATIVSPERHGLQSLNQLLRLSWFLGDMVIGLLYDSSLPALIPVSVGLQLLAVPMLLAMGRRAWA